MFEPESPKASFLLIQPRVAPETLRLDAPVISIGRANECTIPIRDRFLSRRHAEVRLESGQWLLRDCNSANGTRINGARVSGDVALRPGDRIGVGDAELVFGEREELPSQLIAIDDDSVSSSDSVLMSAPLPQTDTDTRTQERMHLLNGLALELIDDRPMEELFDFILGSTMDLLEPSRAALALLGPDRTTFETVRLRRSDSNHPTDLTISRTLLSEVLDGKRVVSFVDTASASNEKLLAAQSIIGQSIRCAVCAPLLVGDAVLGVLYIDYQRVQHVVRPADLTFFGHVARFAATKLEMTRLREEAIAKAKMDQELRTAYEIQSRLLPQEPPPTPGYSFAGINRPCLTVSGDYFDYIVRPDGRIYSIIADVSGKGMSAALVMSSLATAFSIFTRRDPSPDELMRDLNLTMTPKTAPRKFATSVVAVLDPATGRIDFANAGHVPPLLLTRNGITQLRSTDLVIGLFEQAKYRTQSVELEPGSAIILFTDGVTEAENREGEELGIERVEKYLSTFQPIEARHLAQGIVRYVSEYVGGEQMADDLTIVVVSRDA
jgi:serine phosphatase RsbU (regulator of sigma subunit)/pSer/pThr/pTyr-binding forkhead associated (FHA) protein